MVSKTLTKGIPESLSRAFLLILLTSPLFYQLILSEGFDETLPSSPDQLNDTLDIEVDGFSIDGSLGESITDELFGKQEEKADDPAYRSGKVREELGKVCPYGFFMCNDGECISAKWKCDGAYDCDDFSDELNCTGISDAKFHFEPSTHVVPQSPSKQTTSGPKTTKHQDNNLKDLTFNSTEEPLMLFSTGLSIRGLWMRRRVYFDVVGSDKSKPPKTEPPSISQALAVLFGLLSVDRPGPLSSSSSTAKQPEQESTPQIARSTIVGVDMDPDNKEVFWVELGRSAGIYSTVIENEHFESRHRRQYHSRYNTIVDSGLLAPEDVAIDYLAKNIYITDAGLPAIVVCAIRHSHCRMIAEENLHKPRALLVDPSTGWLTYSDWGDHPGIFLVTMDGRRRETLIDTEVVWPNGLAADHAANQLYWADARLSKIERIDLATKKRKIIVQESQSNPFSLSLFENRLYWSDWSGNEIKTCDKSIGSNSTKSLMTTENIYGIHIYHPSLIEQIRDHATNPCWSKHCTHLCLLSPTLPKFSDRRLGSITPTCSCPDSMFLSIQDGSTCYEKQFSFLLINVRNYIAQVFPDRIGINNVEKVIYSKEHVIHDIASDWINHRLFFFDAAKKHIYRSHLTIKDSKIDILLPVTQHVKGLLYDALSDNLYWLDFEHGTLSMGAVESKFELVLKKNLDKPVSLVLDHKNRVFYIAMLGGSTPRIMRTDIFGSESSDLVITGTDVGLPVALHLDVDNQRLYWADAKHESIESIDVDLTLTSGVKPNSHIVHRKNLGTILALSVYQNHFLWTIKNGDYLYRAKIHNREESSIVTGSHAGDTRPVTFKLPPNPSAKEPSSDNKRIILVDPLMEGLYMSSPCFKRGCSHACVLNSTSHPICVCPDGYTVTNDTKSHGEPSPTDQRRCVPFFIAEPIVQPQPEPSRAVWVFILLIPLSLAIIVVVSLFLYRQGRLPSQLSVSFVSYDKDAMLLLDDA